MTRSAENFEEVPDAGAALDRIEVCRLGNPPARSAPHGSTALLSRER